MNDIQTFIAGNPWISVLLTAGLSYLLGHKQVLGPILQRLLGVIQPSLPVAGAPSAPQAVAPAPAIVTSTAPQHPAMAALQLGIDNGKVDDIMPVVKSLASPAKPAA